MYKKLAKIKYLHNNFKIIENGDHVLCAVSGKKISLDNLNYWNVETQEAYFSYKEAHQKREKKHKSLYFPSIMCPDPLFWVCANHFF